MYRLCIIQCILLAEISFCVSSYVVTSVFTFDNAQYLIRFIFSRKVLKTPEMSFLQFDDAINVCTANTKVFKDECAFSFATPDEEPGLFICLRYFISVAPALINDYAKACKCPIFLHFKITKTLKKISKCIHSLTQRFAL